MEELIRRRLETLRAQRAHLAQALAESRQRAAECEAGILQHDGAIAELSALLRPAEVGQEAGPVPYENTDPMRRTVPDSDMRAGAAS